MSARLSMSPEEKSLQDIIEKTPPDFNSPFTRSIVLGHEAAAEKTFHFEMYSTAKGVEFFVKYDSKELYGFRFSDACGMEEYDIFVHIVHHILPKQWNKSMLEEDKNMILHILQNAYPLLGTFTKAAR